MQNLKSKFKNSNLNFLILVTTYYLLFTIFTGCAITYVPTSKPKISMPGIYHQIQRGQTLWKISKIYNADLEELIKINRISDVSRIEIGQLIFIPRAQEQKTQNFSKFNSFEDFIWPLKGKIIATFGQNFNNIINKGINIQISGIQDVMASRTGEVIFYADNFKSFGKTIIIDHGDGFSTVYTGNSQVFVRAGDAVQQKTVIARTGSIQSKDAYLHFEIRKGHIPQNPYFYLSQYDKR